MACSFIATSGCDGDANDDRESAKLATEIFSYLEIFHNRQRRHSALGMLTPVEFEARHQQPTSAA